MSLKRRLSLILLLGLILALCPMQAFADPPWAYDSYYYRHHGRHCGWDRPPRHYWQRCGRPYGPRAYAVAPAYVAPAPVMIQPFQAQPYYSPPAAPGLHGQFTF